VLSFEWKSTTITGVDFLVNILYIECMHEMTKDDIQRLLAENKELIKSHFYVQEIGFFGSYITGQNTPASDIDILVDFQKGHKDLFNYMRLKHFLEELLGREIDLVLRSAVRPQIKANILAQVRYV